MKTSSRDQSKDVREIREEIDMWRFVAREKEEEFNKLKQSSLNPSKGASTDVPVIDNAKHREEMNRINGQRMYLENLYKMVIVIQ